jgi:hypothetical protein
LPTDEKGRGVRGLEIEVRVAIKNGRKTSRHHASPHERAAGITRAAIYTLLSKVPSMEHGAGVGRQAGEIEFQKNLVYFREVYGALGGTRTPTILLTATSRQRVYQFRHER